VVIGEALRSRGLRNLDPRHEARDRQVDRAGRGEHRYGYAPQGASQRAGQRVSQAPPPALHSVCRFGSGRRRLRRREVPPGDLHRAVEPRHQQEHPPGGGRQPLASRSCRSCCPGENKSRTVLQGRRRGQEGHVDPPPRRRRLLRSRHRFRNDALVGPARLHHPRDHPHRGQQPDRLHDGPEALAVVVVLHR
jgi:hypothetical protein